MKGKFLFIILVASYMLVSCQEKKIGEAPLSVIQTNKGEKGIAIEIKFLIGKYHNHPTFSFWVEDLEGNYIETLYVTQYLAKGIFGHGSLGEGKWDSKPGTAKRPSTLPYWLNMWFRASNGKSVLPSPENPVPDAITGATPPGDFILETVIDKPVAQKFRVMMEINQPWDWNEYWNNGSHPGDFDYAVSCQPALVYSVIIDRNQPGKDFYLNPIGHSHYSGLNGELFTDISTLSTAKEIVNKVCVKIINN
jgi:hypothetical protein